MKKLCLAALAIAALTAVNVYSQEEPSPPPPPPRPPKVITKQAGPGATVDEFYKNNPSVSHIYAADDKRIIVKLRSGTKEEYNVNDETEKKNFVNKYGKVPLLPPPPPPPPKPPKKII